MCFGLEDFIIRLSTSDESLLSAFYSPCEALIWLLNFNARWFLKARKMPKSILKAFLSSGEIWATGIYLLTDVAVTFNAVR